MNIYKFTNLSTQLTKNSLTAVMSPLGMGWNTARQRHVPQMASRINPSNMFHSTSVINFFLRGFFSPNTQRVYGSRSIGGLAPTRLTVFFGSAAASSVVSAAAAPFCKGTASPLAVAGSFNPFSTTGSMLEGTSNQPEKTVADEPVGQRYREQFPWPISKSI